MSWIIRNQLNQRPCLIYCLFCILLVSCSNPNTNAPSQNSTHVAGYLMVHTDDALTDLDKCIVCHRNDFQGTGPETDCTVCHDTAPSFDMHAIPYTAADLHGTAAKHDLLICFGCHGTSPNSFDGGVVSDTELFNKPAGNCSTTTCHPAAGAHPTNWQGSNDISGDYLSSHRTSSRQDSSCAICHDYTLGRTAPNSQAPSCFSTGFTNADGSTTTCHPDGGGTAPHDLPYTDPQSHGADARADLAACQVCHGMEGTILFNGGTASVSCSSTLCHPAAGAHPTRWQGSNDNTVSYRSSHRHSNNRSTSCAICHDYVSGRTAPNPNSPSCYTRNFTNADGVTSECHD